jgi:hypothetical protein
VSLQPPPHDGLIELVRAKEQRKSGKGQVVAPLMYMSRHVNADHGQNDPADDVSLR